MSAGIKRMLAERAALAAPPEQRFVDPFAHLFDMIDRAAPFMDEGSPPNKWKPSELLKVTFCIMATGHTGPKKAAQFVLTMLDRARRLWIDGAHPDPWAKEAGG